MQPPRTQPGSAFSGTSPYHPALPAAESLLSPSPTAPYPRYDARSPRVDALLQPQRPPSLVLSKSGLATSGPTSLSASRRPSLPVHEVSDFLHHGALDSPRPPLPPLERNAVVRPPASDRASTGVPSANVAALTGHHHSYRGGPTRPSPPAFPLTLDDPSKAEGVSDETTYDGKTNSAPDQRTSTTTSSTFPKRDTQGKSPWSDLKTKAGKERKRLPLACIACRRKKIRCSGEAPTCQTCLKSRSACVYKVSPRKAAARTDYVAMLERRMRRMEDRIIKLAPRSEAASFSRAVLNPSKAGHASDGALKGLRGGGARAGRKRDANEAFQAELDDWAKAVPKMAQAAKVTPAAQEEGSASPTQDLLTEGGKTLPSREIQGHLVQVFFDFVYGQSYHLLHKPTFMRQFE